MFVNKPYNVKQLFSNLKYVVIDEVHSFIGTDRGIQLKSILSRLQKVNSKSFSVVGLSATIGDYDEAKKFTGDELKTKVLLDRTAKEINALFRYFKNKNEELPLELLKDLYIETKDNKVLIFPNSRGRAEEVAVKLRKNFGQSKRTSKLFSHHSSVDKRSKRVCWILCKKITMAKLLYLLHINIRIGHWYWNSRWSCSNWCNTQYRFVNSASW